MARVTVEDCIRVLPNTFELVLLGSQRARELGAGDLPAVVTEGEKNTVIALREIAAGRVDPERLRESLIRSLQRIQPEEEPPEEDELDQLIAALADFTGSDILVDLVDETSEPDDETSEPETDKDMARVEAPEDR